MRTSLRVSGREHIQCLFDYAPLARAKRLRKALGKPHCAPHDHEIIQLTSGLGQAQTKCESLAPKYGERESSGAQVLGYFL